MVKGTQLSGIAVSDSAQTAYAEKYFDRNKIMQINIEISEENWADMIDNATKEEFHEATVIVNGDTYPLVYIRPKGNSSLSTISKSKFNEDGHLKRFSLKLNFNDLNKTQTLEGLTQLNLNNGFSDPSFIREYLGYQIFEQMGVKVPVFSFAEVSVNGEYFGLFLAVESILEPYLLRNFGEDAGVLYKSVGNMLKYTGNVSTDTNGLLVKSGKKNANPDNLEKMLKALDTGVDLEKYLDVDQALRYIAVSTALVNFDSYQGNFGHNYYLYEQNGKFTILPWDLNMAFGGFSFQGDFSNFYIDEPTQGSLADRPLIAKLLENEEYKERYHAYLQEIVTQYLNKTYLKSEISRLVALISDSVYKDPTALYTFEDFKANTTLFVSKINIQKIEEIKETTAGSTSTETTAASKRKTMMREKASFSQNTLPILSFVLSAAESIQKQLDGEIPSINNGKGMGSEMGGAPRMEQGRTPPGVDPDAPEGEWVPPNWEPEDGAIPQPPMGAIGEPPVGDRMPPMDGQRLEGTAMNTTRSTWMIVIGGFIMIMTILIVLAIPKRKWIPVR
jgi:spore coat protein CotH